MPKKQTLEEFIKKSNIAHNFKSYTIRYYENAGLIPDVDRSGGNARMFSDYTKASIILACQFDFTWHNDASILVKTPTKAEQAANKNYVDTQISTISQFDSSSDQTISGTWKFSKPLKITEAQLTDEAVSKGYVDETIQQNLNTTLEGVIKFVSMTKAEYKALETKSPSTIYHLTDVSMWAIGDQEIVTSNMPA